MKLKANVKYIDGDGNHRETFGVTVHESAMYMTFKGGTNDILRTVPHASVKEINWFVDDE